MLTPLRRPLAVAAAGLALAWGAAAAAADPCPLRLSPADAPAPWREAVAAAQGRLARGDAHDCRSVEVLVGPAGGATLAFVTTDGRGAARALDAPADLGPALEALLITVPAAPPPPSAPPPLAPPAPTSAPAAAPPAQPAPPGRELHLLLGAAAAARSSAVPVGYLSPAIALRAGLTIDRWELGLGTDFAPAHVPLTVVAPDGFALSTFAVGLSVGRREPLGPVALGYGVAVAARIYAVEAAEIAGLATARSLDVALPRLGAYGRLVVPREARARFTLELTLDSALGHLRERSTEERQLPGLPRLGASLAAGVEVAVL